MLDDREGGGRMVHGKEEDNKILPCTVNFIHIILRSPLLNAGFFLG
jgi:hypothetical protein